MSEIKVEKCERMMELQARIMQATDTVERSVREASQLIGRVPGGLDRFERVMGALAALQRSMDPMIDDEEGK